MIWIWIGREVIFHRLIGRVLDDFGVIVEWWRLVDVVMMMMDGTCHLVIGSRPEESFVDWHENSLVVYTTSRLLVGWRRTMMMQLRAWQPPSLVSIFDIVGGRPSLFIQYCRGAYICFLWSHRMTMYNKAKLAARGPPLYHCLGWMKRHMGEEGCCHWWVSKTGGESERELAANFLKMTETKMRCGETVPQGVKEAFHTSPDVTLLTAMSTDPYLDNCLAGPWVSHGQSLI